jgi:pyruvate dehydrogenase E1 component alpha subunit/2-oxoisovalerate dehydrogenase E1 component alpha subunit
VTYRIGAHSTSDDPTRYRSNDEVEDWKRKDPVDRLRRHLVSRGLASDEGDRAMDEELGAEIGAVVNEVEKMPPPARASLFDDVYAALPWHLREQQAAGSVECQGRGPGATWVGKGVITPKQG